MSPSSRELLSTSLHPTFRAIQPKPPPTAPSTVSSATAVPFTSPPSTCTTRFRCRSCIRPRWFYSKHDLAQHRLTAHLTPDDAWFCEPCSLQFHTERSHRAHQQLHADNICLYCNVGFPSEADVREHIRSRHIPPAAAVASVDGAQNLTEPMPQRLRFTCNQCDAFVSFSSRRALLRHTRSKHVHQAGRYLCGLCSRTAFDSRDELREHLRNCRPVAGEMPASATTASMQIECDGDAGEDYINTDKDNDIDDVDAALNFGSLDDDMPVEFLNYNLLAGGGMNDIDDGCCFDSIYMDGMVEEFLDDAFQIQPPLSTMTTDQDGSDKSITTNTSAGTSTAPSARHTYACPHCPANDGATFVTLFTKQRDLHLHLAEKHNEPSLVCYQCGVGFSSMVLLREHHRQHQIENTMANESLAQMFDTRDEDESSAGRRKLDGFDCIRNPSSVEESVLYHCRKCHRRYRKRMNALRHRCPLNDQSGTAGSDDQTSDMRPAADGVAAKTSTLICSLCDKSFRTLNGLKYHLGTHTSDGELPFPCAYCPQRFHNAILLSAHLRKRHAIVNDAVRPKRVQCGKCALSFAAAYLLRRHEAVEHGGQRNYVCKVCGAAYTQCSHLRHHEMSHTGLKPFACSQCDRSFTSRSSLRKHEERGHRRLEEQSQSV